jgi:predicted esterase
MKTLSYRHKRYSVRRTADVKFGVGGIGFSTTSGALRYRDLLLDIYEPIGNDDSERPALILAFGGAFHRGSRVDDMVQEGEHRNTPISEYCHEFARRGYVCFSIDYRLMQEAPDPGSTPTLPAGIALNTERVNYVRGLLGLAPCTQQDMAFEIEAATDDMTLAVSFVRARSRHFNIDANRIAIGGFSAGAIIALNAALAERVAVAAVLALSGRISMATANQFVRHAKDGPALLMFIGENDLPAMLEDLDAPTRHLSQLGIPTQVVRIANATHFYLRSAQVKAPDGTPSDVETSIADFLYTHLRLADL